MSKKYDKYLKRHHKAVVDAANCMLDCLSTSRVLTDDEKARVRWNVRLHDASKRGDAEYGPYDRYLYGNANERTEDEFVRAWLHHIHNNPHHWQHWLLMNDDGKYRDPDKVIPLEMPREHAFEMVADWWSFSWLGTDMKSIVDWYLIHKDSIILHENTREFVEDIIEEIYMREW